MAGLLFEQVPAQRVKALAGVLAGFRWPKPDGSYEKLSKAQQRMARNAAALALAYLHQAGVKDVTCHMPIQIMENGEQVYLEQHQVEALRILGLIYYCPYCGPHANVYHLHGGRTMEQVRQVIS